VVFGKILHDLDGAIPHITDADSCHGRQGSDESAKILELRTEAGASSVVKQEEQLESGTISPARGSNQSS
jgi:hypothetical protein